MDLWWGRLGSFEHKSFLSSPPHSSLPMLEHQERLQDQNGHRNSAHMASGSFTHMASPGGMAPGLTLMIAKRGPTPKKKDGNCKEQGARRCFWPLAPLSLKPSLHMTWNMPPKFK